MDREDKRRAGVALARAQIGLAEYRAVLEGELILDEALERQHVDESRQEEVPDCGFESDEEAWMKVKILHGLKNKLTAVPYIDGELPEEDKLAAKGVFAHKATLAHEVPALEQRGLLVDDTTRVENVIEALLGGDHRAEGFRRWLVDDAVDYREEVLRELDQPLCHLLRAHALAREPEVNLEASVVEELSREFLDVWEQAKNPVNGYVYFLGSEEHDYVKIGRATNLDARVNTLAIQLPYRVELLHTVECADEVRTEAEYHRRFAGKRLNGEWFKLSGEDMERVRTVGYVDRGSREWSSRTKAMNDDSAVTLENLRRAIGGMQTLEDVDRVERIAEDHLREHPADEQRVGSMMEEVVMQEGALWLIGPPGKEYLSQMSDEALERRRQWLLKMLEARPGERERIQHTLYSVQGEQERRSAKRERLQRKS